MNHRIAALVLAAACLVFGAQAAGADTVVQNQNSSSGAEATSGDAEASNEAEVQTGPRAQSSSGPAQSSQIGNNSARVRQDSQARSGDAAAGSQVTGARGGSGTVQNQNSSTGSVATTGDALASNVADIGSGPDSVSGFGPASASQTGSNDVDADLGVTAETGDAVSGSQITGIL